MVRRGNTVRRTAAALLVTVGLCALASLAWSPSASALDGLVTGSWWTGQNDANNVPVPPTVPTGGLWVQYNASGATAFSAVRFTMAPTEAAPILSLGVHSQQPSGVAIVVACIATTDWNPVTAGPMSAAPAYDCARGSSQGTFNADGTVMTFDLSGFLVGDTINVVLRPAPVGPAPPGVPLPAPPATLPVSIPPAPTPTTVPTAPSPTPFDITFEPPSAANIAIASVPLADESPNNTTPTTFAFDTTPAEPVFSGPIDLSTESSFITVPTTSPPRAVLPVVNVPRQIIPALPAATTTNLARALAGAVFLLLAAWMARDMFGGAAPAGGSGRRISLVPDPPTAGRAELVKPPRVGKPTPLR